MIKYSISESSVPLTLVRSTPVRALTETGSSASRRFTSPVTRLPSPLKMTISFVLDRGAATLPAIYIKERGREKKSNNPYFTTMWYSIMWQNTGTRVICLSRSDQREHQRRGKRCCWGVQQDKMHCSKCELYLRKQTNIQTNIPLVLHF